MCDTFQTQAGQSEQAVSSLQTTHTAHLYVHKEKLTLFCRLCGGFRHQNIGFPVSNYKDQLQKFFNVSVENDIDTVHPKLMCNPCRLRIRRLQEKLRKKRSTDTDFVAHIWEEHSIQDCGVCEFYIRKSPRKPTPMKRKIDEKHESTSIKKQLFSSNQDVDAVVTDQSALLNLKLPEITSIPCENIVQSIGVHVGCCLCFSLPLKPVIAGCSHLYCSDCVNTWLISNSVCKVCHEPTSTSDLQDVTNVFKSLYESLTVRCFNSLHGCKVITNVLNYKEHYGNCEYSSVPDVTFETVQHPAASIQTSYRSWENKIPLLECRKHYARSFRLKHIICELDKFCEERHEVKVDVLYFLLMDELTRLGQHDKAGTVRQLTCNVLTNVMSADEALAMRIDLLQSKSQYRKQYDLLKTKGDSTFAPPSQVESKEKDYMPSSCTYEVSGQEYHDHFSHEQDQSSPPLDIMEDFNIQFPEHPVPNCKGVRFHYADAISKTLEELDPLIAEGLTLLGMEDKSNIIKTFIKDGGDGMGDVAVHKEKSLRYLPDKALRFSFCIFECQIMVDGEYKTVYRDKAPNSVRTNRPLMEALADENNKASAVICLLPIEMERDDLRGKLLKVKTGPNEYRVHEIQFISSMLDEKYDRAFGGLQAAGSKYLCTLCYATTESAREKLGSFSIQRTLQDTSEFAEYLRVNPDNLDNKTMQNIVKGVKSSPLLQIEPKFRMIDATHADINMATFFKKLLVRCIADVRQWDATKALKKSLDDSEVRFDKHIKEVIGSNPQLMMPGNYARMLFDEKNWTKIVGILPLESDRLYMTNIFVKFRQMRYVYRANVPNMEDVYNYKSISISLGNMLLEHYTFARWPNSLHKLIEHVQEILLDEDGPRSLGALSGEGNEAGNKIFRHLRKNLASKGSTQQGLVDVLRTHWLYSSPKLQMLSTVKHREYRCSFCYAYGHNRLSCPKQ